MHGQRLTLQRKSMKVRNRRILATLLFMTIPFTMSGCAKQQSESNQKQTDKTGIETTELQMEEKEPDYSKCYADSDYNVPTDFDAKRTDVVYGTVQSHLTYDSQVAGKAKEYSIILPPNYSDTEKYPVIYALHGFGGQPGDWEFANTIYSNMVADGLAAPALFVIPEMWTDSKSFAESNEYEQRASYDRIAEDMKVSLMPYIESHYPVLTGKDHTGIIGLSQGETESLATGFLLQDRIGFIASLAPCPGVIPTEYYKDTFWNIPIMDDFTINTPDTMPHYILLTVGSEDPWDIECTQYYDQVMTQESIPHQYYMLDGGDHDYMTWAHSLYNFVRRSFPAE